MPNPLLILDKGWPVRWKSEEVDQGEWIYHTVEKIEARKVDTKLVESLWDIRYERVMELLQDDHDQVLRFSSAHQAKIASGQNTKMPRGGRHWKYYHPKKNMVLPIMQKIHR